MPVELIVGQGVVLSFPAIAGPAGPAGAAGTAGAAGVGLPAGGTTGQVPAKTSNADFAIAWTTPSSGGGAVASVNGDIGVVLVTPASIGAAATAALTSESNARIAGDALAIPLTQKGVANGVATLDVGGFLTAAQLPSITISDFLGTVASQAAMLALVGQRGDWCNRSDLSQSLILTAEPSSVLGNWQALLSPAGGVGSVNGRTGVVTGLAEQTSLDTESSARSAADAALQPLDSDLTAIAALTTTAYGRAFLALADAAAGRTALGLGTAATQASGAFDASGLAAAAQAASQPLDSDLTAIAALTTTAFGRSVLDRADAAALRTLAGSVIGTNVQAWDADLDTLAARSGSPLAVARINGAGTGLEFVVPVAAAGGTGSVSQLFGDGTDGAATITGGTTTLTSDKQYSSLTVASTGVLNTAGFRVWVSGICQVDAGGLIHSNGDPGSAAAQGFAVAPGWYGGNGGGGAGGVAAGANSVSVSNSLGAPGGVGGAGSGGAGGPVNGITSITAAGAGTTNPAALALITFTIGKNVAATMKGGSGGGGAGGDGTAGPGGGAGGAIVFLLARTLILNGTISANGGAGGTPAAGNRGGGGGGGGGFVGVGYITKSGAGTLSANGGAGGVATGTGVAGAAGTAGTVKEWAIQTSSASTTGDASALLPRQTAPAWAVPSNVWVA